MLASVLLLAATVAPTPVAPAERTQPGAAALAAVDGVRPADAPATPRAPAVVPRTEWDPTGECPVSTGRRTRPRRIQLHHTHVPVVHAPDEVPGALASICGSHQERGFSEIGYHYAIDPFGTIWQGRGPMPDAMSEKVRNGAHAQGFNDNSMGVVLIGDFDEAPPSAEALEATEQLLAFLAGQYDMDPSASVGAESTGGPATRFDEGEVVDLPAIAGHRDTGLNTSCPGEHLYALLPQLREAVAERLDRAG